MLQNLQDLLREISGIKNHKEGDKMAITQEKNIEMLEKLPDGNFKIKYPKTKAEQVIGLETAQKILDKIKTVDGTGSGLDADTLDGQHASAFQTFNLSYGKTSFNEPIGISLITKQIPIGSGKTRAMVVVQPSTGGGSRGVMVICGTDKTKTYAVGHNGASQGGGANSRQVNNFVTQYNNFGSDSAGQRIEIIDMYISGSNLVIVFKNNVTTGQEFTINCSISWEAW